MSMADEVNTEQAPTEGQQQDQVHGQVEAAAPKPSKAPKAPRAKVVDDGQGEVETPKPDPMMQQLVAAQRELDAARKELESHRQRVKQFERDQRKQSILAALVDEFPGLPRQEIRGAALVAAEDGAIDLFAEDPSAAIAHIKEMLRPKSKKPSASTSPPASLGGTPGSPSKPPTPSRGKFLL